MKIDHQVSFDFFVRAAADQGHPHAQYNLAAAHLNGHDAGLDEVRFVCLKTFKAYDE